MLAAQLVIDTIDRSKTAVAILIPAKGLQLQGQFTQRELLNAIDKYVSAETIPSKQNFVLNSVLDQQVEVLIVIDGLDELARDLAARVLRQAAALPEHWPTIQILATARPVELLGVSYADWLIVNTCPLDDTSKKQFIREELVADGYPNGELEERTTSLFQLLKSMSALDAIAVSPLIIRLLYQRLSSISPDSTVTLGDLLYELLLERLGGWQKRDDKPRTFDYLEEILPTPEAKAEFLATLAQRVISGHQVTIDEAKSILEDAAGLKSGVNRHLLAEETLACFEWLGLLTRGDLIEFPVQPLAEVTAAVGLMTQWRSDPKNREMPDHAQWRVVSFGPQ